MTASRMTQPAELLSVGGVNVILQVLTSVSKAVLLVALARYLTPLDVGVFGLLFVTIGLATYIIGLDFSAFSMRELLKRDRLETPRILVDQLVLHGLTYVLALPLLLFLFIWQVLPWGLALCFYGLLIFDHIAAKSSGC